MKIEKQAYFSILWAFAPVFFIACKSLDPNRVLSSPTPPQAYSRVNVPLEVPFETLTNLVNQRVPPVILEEKGLDLGNGILGDLAFRRNGMIQVEGLEEKQLKLTFPLQVTGEIGLKPGGLRNLFQNKIPIDQSFSPSIVVNPEIASNWSLGVSKFELLDLGGKLTFSVLGFDLDLSQLVSKEISQYAAEKIVGRNDLLALKPMVDQAWNQAGKPIFVDFQGKRFAFSIQPDSVKISEKVYPGEGYHLNLGLSGKVNSHPAEAAPSRAFPLPNLTPNQEEGNFLDIRIPIFLSYGELDQMMAEIFGNQSFRINKTTVFTATNLKSQAYGDQLGIWMDFTAIQTGKEEIHGRLFLVGSPVFDPEGEALAFEEVNFYLESDSKKAKTAASFKKGKIIRQLNKKLRFPMGDTFESGIFGLEERLNLETLVANLKVGGLEIRPSGFYPGKLGLNIHLQATGQVEVSWK